MVRTLRAVAVTDYPRTARQYPLRGPPPLLDNGLPPADIAGGDVLLPSVGMELDAAVGPALMREVLGHFASGVVVVTAAGPDGPIGFTCQSFASLSLDPPLVSFAPARTSSTWPRIRRAGRFCVNVLADHHQELSAAFARSGTDKFAGVAWAAAPSGAPVLDGTCAWIDCSLSGEYYGGDHTIVVGRVHGLGADGDRLPLLFHRGTYGVAAAQMGRGSGRDGPPAR